MEQAYDMTEKSSYRITMERDILGKQIELVYDLASQMRERLSAIMGPDMTTIASENIPKVIDPMSAMAESLRDYQRSVQGIRGILEDVMERLEL